MIAPLLFYGSECDLQFFGKIQSILITVTQFTCRLCWLYVACLIRKSFVSASLHPAQTLDLIQIQEVDCLCTVQTLYTPFDLKPLTSGGVNWTEHCFTLVDLCSMPSSKFTAWFIMAGLSFLMVDLRFMNEHHNLLLPPYVSPSIHSLLPPMKELLGTQWMEAMCQGRATDAL